MRITVNKDEYEMKVMNLITNSGQSKSEAMSAIHHAKQGDFAASSLSFEECSKFIKRAHDVQTSLIGLDEGEGDVDENIIQVKNIFKVINDTLSQIHQKAGFLPQVIVMEHADEPEFSSYIRARWKNDGEKLI